MAERKVDLQTAVNAVTEMLRELVQSYKKLRAAVPSFGVEYDCQLAKYFDAIASSVQGTAVWYYISPRELLLLSQVITPLNYFQGTLEV